MKESNMAFLKHSVAVTTPKRTNLSNPHAAPVAVGEERDGMVWDGTTWVSKQAWEARAKRG
jgi:hypothetical protein